MESLQLVDAVILLNLAERARPTAWHRGDGAWGLCVALHGGPCPRARG